MILFNQTDNKIKYYNQLTIVEEPSGIDFIVVIMNCIMILSSLVMISYIFEIYKVIILNKTCVLL